MINFLHKAGYIYHIPHNILGNRLLKVVSREEKISFVITATATMGLIIYNFIPELFLYTYA